jgi:hypothetical protein
VEIEQEPGEMREYSIRDVGESGIEENDGE